MEKVIKNIIQEMNELIKLNKEKDNKIINLEFENSKLKEELSNIDFYKKKLEKINIPRDERIEKLTDDIETIIEKYTERVFSSLGCFNPRDMECSSRTDKKKFKAY